MSSTEFLFNTFNNSSNGPSLPELYASLAARQNASKLSASPRNSSTSTHASLSCSPLADDSVTGADFGQHNQSEEEESELAMESGTIATSGLSLDLDAMAANGDHVKRPMNA